MLPRIRVILLAAFCSLGLSYSAPAQVPEKFTNLQYFPKDIQRDDLIQVMRGFSFSLGARCEYCHAAKDGDPPEKRDFASDEKETKRTARAMLRMLDAINQNYIAKLDSQTQNRVACVTCHHGLSKPKGISHLLNETLEAKGIPDAVSQYKDLRKQYYGGAQYDFSETPLNQLAESLNRGGKTKEAVAIMELNAEVNAPLSGWGDSVLAMAHMANKDVDKAKADFERIVTKNPQNTWAKKQLEQLNQKPN